MLIERKPDYATVVKQFGFLWSIYDLVGREPGWPPFLFLWVIGLPMCLESLILSQKGFWYVGELWISTKELLSLSALELRKDLL